MADWDRNRGVSQIKHLNFLSNWGGPRGGHGSHGYSHRFAGWDVRGGGRHNRGGRFRQNGCGHCGSGVSPLILLTHRAGTALPRRFNL
jgi:hypothetical protein